ncbi:MAG TPA: hypothetical protein VHA56_08855 [Mucilaginibacter sp.]|nr:hypothetical protein [Mucilaginibacter sp.]
MKIRIFGGLLVALIAITSIASAQSHTPVIRHRNHVQERRINHGVRNGSLTRTEARHMRARERKIDHDRRLARADGRISPAERRHLRREENRSSRAIYRHKHNGRVR